MKNQCLVYFFALAIIAQPGCKEKEAADPKEAFIPVLSIIKSQVKHVDTSLYSVIKINYMDNMPVDTEYIHPENFHVVARDFLELPELSKKEFAEENIPGPTDNLSTIIYKPLHPGKNNVQRVDLVIDPALAETGQNVIKSIFVERGFTNRDSAIQKIMLWRIDKSFQVTTISQKKGQEETTHTFKVIWNEDENE